MRKFQLKSDFKPTGHQPQAIKQLSDGLKTGHNFQTLLGVTGSGKTFSVANVIAQRQLPTLVISHNKTLAAQLYQEFKEFFPENAVSYFVSYYDYYQPEAYVPQTDTYIAKEADINQEIDKLRLQATSNIFSRDDVIVVASVSCIYNIGSPEEYRNRTISFKLGQAVDQKDFLAKLVNIYYQRSRLEIERGKFRIRGNIVEIAPAYSDEIIRVEWQDNQISRINKRSFFSQKTTDLDNYLLYPAKHYLADEQILNQAFSQIKKDLKTQLKKLESQGKMLEANRLEQRVNYDLDMISEMGYVNGIENYSRYFDGRSPGDPPYSLVDYFVKKFGQDFLVVIDESHMTVPQIKGMYRGDQSRKQTLIDFGFRLPASLDNRPLKAGEFWQRVDKAIFVSATPSDWEIKKSGGRIVEQLIRPTGLVDPQVEVRSTDGQIQDLINEVVKRQKKGERVLITTLTKRMAEELASYLADPAKTKTKLKVNYVHSDVDTLERSDILADLRRGEYDVLVGVNLLREGLDLPEVSLVAILDADKQGFLRSKTALIQTMGRAARNKAGLVVLYADEQSLAMRQAISEVKRRRSAQLDYNHKHGIDPETIKKPIRDRIIEKQADKPTKIDSDSLTPGEAKKMLPQLRRQMRQYARALDFEQAAQIRDQIEEIKQKFKL